MDKGRYMARAVVSQCSIPRTACFIRACTMTRDLQSLKHTKADVLGLKMPHIMTAPLFPPVSRATRSGSIPWNSPVSLLLQAGPRRPTP